MLIERRRVEAALLRSRGAGTTHLSAMAFGEALLLAIPAALIAPYLAVGVVQLLATIGPLAGAGIAGGRVYGKSNKLGEHPVDKPVRPEQLAATVYHALDIPINDPQDASGISRSLTTGQPVLDLFG